MVEYVTEIPKQELPARNVQVSQFPCYVHNIRLDFFIIPELLFSISWFLPLGALSRSQAFFAHAFYVMALGIIAMSETLHRTTFVNGQSRKV